MKVKSLFLALFCVLFAFSCKKESDTGKVTPVYYFLEIQVDELYHNVSMSVNATEPKKIPVALKASSLGGIAPEVSMFKDVVVSIAPEGFVDFSVESDGVSISPKAVGSATLTLSPKTLLGQPVSCEVTVLEKQAEPVSVSITKTGTDFSDGVLQLKEGGSFPLQAVVMNDKGAVSLDCPLKWSVISGDSYIQVSQDGLVSAISNPGGVRTASVLVEVDGLPSLNDNVTVRVQPLPTGIKLNIVTDIPMWEKVGEDRSFTYEVLPAGAYDDVTVSLTSTDASLSVSGNTVTIRGIKSGVNPIVVTLTSQSKPQVSKAFQLFVVDYASTDIKSGDYVYYNAAYDTFITQDCGLRFTSGTSVVYQVEGVKSDTPAAYLGEEVPGFGKFIGIVVTTDLGSDGMGCDLLEECKNKASATGLYEYRSYQKSKLRGFYGRPATHALILKKDQSNEKKEWQHNNEHISSITEQKGDLYLSQLNRYLAFSQEDYNYGYSYEQSGSTRMGSYSKYCTRGFVPHLLMKFYNQHLGNSNYSVIPVKEIDSYADGVPGIASGSSNAWTTGWFLPGNKEWALMKDNLSLVNKSLKKCGSGATSLSGNYWSTEEDGEYCVWSYDVSESAVSRRKYYKDTRTHTNGSAFVRAVLYL